MQSDPQISRTVKKQTQIHPLLKEDGKINLI